ncbi:MAG TPA: hypothetical protein DCZ75_02280 [Geobacter sp.]|nr:hypothetical protein [Geobacter sp.]
MKTVWLVLVCAFLAACGSGSKEGSGTGGKVMTPDQVTATARLQIASQGPTADAVLYAAQFTLHLPQGVTLPTSTEGGLLPPGVLVPAPSGSYAGATYLPATNGSAASVQVNITHPGGFTVGPLATLNCSVSPGTDVAATSFTLEAFSARDGNGIEIPEITAHLALLKQ